MMQTSNKVYVMKAKAHSSQDLQRGVMREVALCYLIENYYCEFFEKYRDDSKIATYLLQGKLHMGKIVKNTLRSAKSNVLDSYSYIAEKIDEYLLDDIQKLIFAYNKEYINLNIPSLHADMMMINFLFELLNKAIDSNYKMATEILGSPVTYTDAENVCEARKKINLIIRANHIVEMYSPNIELSKKIINNKINSTNFLDKLN